MVRSMMKETNDSDVLVYYFYTVNIYINLEEVKAKHVPFHQMREKKILYHSITENRRKKPCYFAKHVKSTFKKRRETNRTFVNEENVKEPCLEIAIGPISLKINDL